MPAHHPFTMPHPDDLDLLATDPAAGALPGLRPGAQRLGARVGQRPDPPRRHPAPGLRGARDLTRRRPRPRFGFLLGAFRYGAPPHAGFALGIDRLVAIFCRGGEHPRGHRLPQDPVGGRPHDRGPQAAGPDGALADLGHPAWSPAPGPGTGRRAERAAMAGRTSSTPPPSDRLASAAPLAARLRPRTLDEVVGQRHLVAPGAPLRVLVEADRLTSAILWGPPGTGKTTLARLVAAATAKAFVPLSAVAAGVADVREALEEARRRLGEQGQGTILFVDEVHRFNKAQQDALLPAVEEGLVVLIGATTENPFFEVNSPLLSRATLWRLEPLADDDLAAVVRAGPGGRGGHGRRRRRGRPGVGGRRRRPGRPRHPGGGGGPGRGPGPGAEPRWHRGRRGAGPRRPPLPPGGRRPLRPDQRPHQERPGLGPRRRPVLAGPDARGRRGRPLHRPAAGHPGQRGRRAWPTPWRWWWPTPPPGPWSSWGCPRRPLNLAQAVVHLACAPKSNRVTVGPRPGPGGRAPAGRRGDVPAHLRDAHYRAAAELGHGEGYRYPHDDPAGWVDQQYRPDEVDGPRLLRALRPRGRGRGWPRRLARRARRQPAAPGDLCRSRR